MMALDFHDIELGNANTTVSMPIGRESVLISASLSTNAVANVPLAPRKPTDLPGMSIDDVLKNAIADIPKKDVVAARRDLGARREPAA